MKKIIWISLLSIFPITYVSAEGVCSGQPALNPSTPTENFEFLRDGSGGIASHDVVIDKKTGLMWTRCLVGSYFDSADGSACFDTTLATPFSWSSALSHIATFNASPAVNQGYTDWRMPNVKELASLLEYSCSPPVATINHEIFAGAMSAKVWTNTPFIHTPGGNLPNETQARVVDFSDANVLNMPLAPDSDVVYLRLVREHPLP
ncbi:MAG: DUF1566 domain-containing protein [Gammaproteobacteria bacterium]|nr:DUF1566 domain-containing protein [Gammaproteobacteria bacterium]